jgi:hypothetical protein
MSDRMSDRRSDRMTKNVKTDKKNPTKPDTHTNTQRGLIVADATGSKSSATVWMEEQKKKLIAQKAMEREAEMNAFVAVVGACTLACLSACLPSLLPM